MFWKLGLFIILEDMWKFTLGKTEDFCTQRSDLQESSWLPLDGLGISIQQGKTCSKSTNLGRNPTLQL